MCEKKGLTIVHPNTFGIPVFDVFGEVPEEFADFGYLAKGCEFVRQAGRDDYVWSEDLMHIKEYNMAVMSLINKLVNVYNFEIRFMGWYDFEEFIRLRRLMPDGL